MKAKTFKKLMLAKAVTEADVIIGLPKLKTHTLTYYTGAVKLLYGYIPGLFKTEYHLHTANDISLFADLLLDIHETYPPALTLMDAIVGMEGAGPSNGKPRKIGLILSSKSCTALDYVAVTIAGFDPITVPTVRLAQERGVDPARLEDVRICGERVQPLVMENFEKTLTANAVGNVIGLARPTLLRLKKPGYRTLIIASVYAVIAARSYARRMLLPYLPHLLEDY